MPLQNDGMPDIGNLPTRVVAIRNKVTGVLVTRDQCPDQESWEHYVRLAYNHQEQMEMLDANPDDKEAGTEKKKPLVPTLPDGTPITKESLKKLHYKTLRKLAVGYEVEVDGKTPEGIIEDVLKKIDHLMETAED